MSHSLARTHYINEERAGQPGAVWRVAPARWESESSERGERGEGEDAGGEHRRQRDASQPRRPRHLAASRASTVVQACNEEEQREGHGARQGRPGHREHVGAEPVARSR